MNRKYPISGFPVAILFALLFVGCKEQGIHDYPRNAYNSAYYWRTTFNVSDAEQQFITKHNVKRLYLRLFDVDMSKRNLWETLSPQPIATIQFPDSANLSQVMQQVDECVPTVFITLHALKQMPWHEANDYAQKICTRILNMCSYHGFRDKVHEVQIDCDWTETTENTYFRLLDEMRYILHAQGIILSATIRLHQLHTSAPPVDRGVLMLYNTGSLKHPETKNSILSNVDAMPYLKRINYSLPLDYAFPNFGWGVWFCNNAFQAILHQQDYSDENLYEQTDSTHYRVIKNHYNEGHWLICGDIIRKEISDMVAIEQIKQHLPFSEATSIIMYHLDENNLKNLDNHEISTFYSRPAAE
jgi:hypothetical protein